MRGPARLERHSLCLRKAFLLIVDLIDEYVARRRETLEIMSVPGLYESIRAASREFRAGKSVSLKDARKKLERGFSE